MPDTIPQANFLYLIAVMTRNSPPDSYIKMLRFLFHGSGIWAMLIISILAITYKSTIGAWFWLDFVIIGLFFMGRGIVEWVIHSWLYHATPLPILGWRLASETSKQHIHHHRNPAELSRLLITYKGVATLSLLVFLGSLLFFQSLNIAATMTLALMVIGFMIEIVHLICHCEIPHKSTTMKRLVFLHRHHHQKDGHNFYGVSSSLGDKVFGTYPLGEKR